MKRILWSAILILVASALAAEPSPDHTRDKLADFMSAAAADGYVGSVIVKREGEILLREGYGTVDPDEDRRVTPETVFTTGSITKQFTAAAILKLEEEGKLSLDDRITQYFDDVPADKRSITIHHLLSHQAGLPGAIGDDRERVGRDEYVERALETDLMFAPGDGYEYSNVGFSLAAAIIEKVSGKSYERFLRDTFFEPLGMADTGYILPKWDPARLAHGRTDDGRDWGTMYDRLLSDGGPGWHLLGNGGIQSTVDDMALWHRALQGTSVLSESSKQKMYARHADEGGGTWYGYGWSIEPTPWGEMVTHNGGNPFFFSDYLRFPEHDLVIYYSNASRDRRHNRIARKLAEIVFTGNVPQLDPRPEPLIEVNSDPSAPEGSPAAIWGFPGSLRGLRAGEFLQAVAHGTDEERRELIATSMSPAIIERNGIPRLLEVFARLREEMGEFEVRGLRPIGEHRAAIVIARSGSPMPMSILLDLEPNDPHRITGIGVEVGD